MIVLFVFVVVVVVNVILIVIFFFKVCQMEFEFIIVIGNVFYKGKERFFVCGIDYQLGGVVVNVDFLVDFKVCKFDIEKFKKFGINIICVYLIDNFKDYDECMEEFVKVGIYVVFDVNNFLYFINCDDFYILYNVIYFQSVFVIIDVFVKYSNIMVFFFGNEVIYDYVNIIFIVCYVKVIDCDMCCYIKVCKYCKILVGYFVVDVIENCFQIVDYFNCGIDEECSDFFVFVS